MEEALDGLQGVLDVQSVLANDHFVVRFDPTEVAPEELLGVIRKLNYEPEWVQAFHEPSTPLPPVNPRSLAGKWQAAFQEGENLGKPVLLEFTGPG